MTFSWLVFGADMSHCGVVHQEHTWKYARECWLTTTTALLCTRDKSQLIVSSGWKIWWNLIHKLLCLTVNDGSGENLQTKAGSSYSRHISVWCPWALVCARERRHTLPCWECVDRSIWLVAWWNTGYTPMIIICTFFLSESRWGAFVLLDDISIMHTRANSHSYAPNFVLCAIHPSCRHVEGTKATPLPFKSFIFLILVENYE